MAELEAMSVPARKGCTVGSALDDFDDKVSATVRAALDRPDITHSAIARAMSDRGARMASTTVGRHRKGQCSCE
jgi:hypothetical protein